MKTNKRLLLIAFTILSKSLYSQKNEANSTVAKPLNNINIGIGDASIISLNYEHLFLMNRDFFISGGLGIGYNEEFQLCIFGPCSSKPSQYLTLPHHVTFNYGSKKIFVEAGIGAAAVIGNTNQYYLMYPTIGFRLQPLRSYKINFRFFGSISIIGFNNGNILFIPAGVSVGLVF